MTDSTVSQAAEIHPLFGSLRTTFLLATSHEETHNIPGVSSADLLDRIVAEHEAQKMTPSFSKLAHWVFHGAWTGFVLSITCLVIGLISSDALAGNVWGVIGVIMFTVSVICFLACMRLARSEARLYR